MNIENEFHFLMNSQYAQLDGNDYKRIFNIQEELEAMNFDSATSQNTKKVDVMIEVCEKLLKDATKWKVEFSVPDNGGTGYYWTLEDAYKAIDEFKIDNNGWNCEVSEPEEVGLWEEGDVPEDKPEPEPTHKFIVHLQSIIVDAVDKQDAHLVSERLIRNGNNQIKVEAVEMFE
jgi:hypothetical protein